MRKLIVIMGPSGCGKSTVARALADACDAEFVEADDYHPPANVARMRAGTALSDDDRAAWLDALTAAIANADSACVVAACSALTPYVQDRLQAESGRAVQFVLLDLPQEALARRLGAREGHFMNPALLESQLAALDAPGSAVRIDAKAAPDVVLQRVIAALDQ